MAGSKPPRKSSVEGGRSEGGGGGGGHAGGSHRVIGCVLGGTPHTTPSAATPPSPRLADKMSRTPSRTGSPGVPRRGAAPRSRSALRPSQKNLWKNVKTRRERSPNFRQSQKTTLVGRYKIEDTVVGRGAWSVVKPAVDVLTSKEYVSKIVRKEDLQKTCSRDEDDEILQEVAVLKHLPKHRHIVEFIELLDQGSEYMVILESLSNGDLCDAILDCEDNTIPEEQAKHYFTMVVEALICCHANGVAHRDVKPENMLLSDNYELKLTDFGLARKHSTNFRCTDEEMTTELVGTLRYAAPELFRGHFNGELYDDFMSDIWSLGVCLYVMLAGVFPFSTGKNTTERDIFELLETMEEVEMPSNCSPEAVSLLSKLLQKNPANRIDIRDIPFDPWCKGSIRRGVPAPHESDHRASPTPPRTMINCNNNHQNSASQQQADWEDMEKEELVQHCRRFVTTVEEHERTIARLRELLADTEAKADDLQKENDGLAREQSNAESSRQSDFVGLRKRMQQGTQMLSYMSAGAGKTRSGTPNSAQRNITPTSSHLARGKPSSSPSIVARKPPPRCASPGTNSLRPNDSGNFGLPQSKPRTLSPRMTGKLPQRTNGNVAPLSRFSRPDSPGKVNTARGTTSARSTSSTKQPGSIRTATPPRKGLPASTLPSKRTTYAFFVCSQAGLKYRCSCRMISFVVQDRRS
ncbi:CBL-interacting serine/threonine-protein kinase 3 [Diplonema papillatum]|nr:CBL-interacting serine/threonine-protein kinase 3 [Diplonema papillatum]